MGTTPFSLLKNACVVESVQRGNGRFKEPQLYNQTVSFRLHTVVHVLDQQIFCRVPDRLLEKNKNILFYHKSLYAVDLSDGYLIMNLLLYLCG